jgi:hypothetical protein
MYVAGQLSNLKMLPVRSGDEKQELLSLSISMEICADA